MIEINLNTARFKLTVKGHAKEEESEKYTEICAAVSALSQSLMYSLTKLPRDAMKSVDYRPEPGNLLIKAYPEQWAEGFVKNRFKADGDGLELLATSHGNSVTFIRDGKRILPEKEEQANE